MRLKHRDPTHMFARTVPHSNHLRSRPALRDSDKSSQVLRASPVGILDLDGWYRQDSTGLMVMSPPIGCDFVAVPAEHHAAPTAMVRFALVTEPEHARLVLAPFH